MEEGIDRLLENMTPTECRVLRLILDNINHKGTTKTTFSKIADKHNIPRTNFVIVLRILEILGIIHKKSCGIAGTYIKVINSEMLEEINDNLK